MKTLLIYLSMVLGCLLVTGNAATIYVPSEVGGVPVVSIQDAISIAVEEDVIVVAQGIYMGGIDLMGKAITVQSVNPMDPEVVAATIVDCGGGYPNGFIFQSGEENTTVIDGFTIANITGFSGFLSSALVCMTDGTTFRGSSPTIRNCVINNNMGDEGAGLYCYFGCNPVIENCLFIANNSYISGGAISIWDGSPILKHCQFIGNKSDFWGGAVSARGGSPVFRDCIFAGNMALSGGCFYFEDTIAPEIVNCTIIDNIATETVSALYATSSSDLKIENSVFWGNATAPGAWIPATIYVAGQDQSEGETASIAYCNIQNFATSVGVDDTSVITMDIDTMVDADPLFVQNGSFTEADVYVPGDCHLQKKSPCINKGNPNYGAAAEEKDIDGEKRVMNGRIDIGVDEIEAAIEAKINIVPNKVYIPCAAYVLAMIRLPEGYFVKDINAASILLNDELAAMYMYRCRQVAVAVFDKKKIQTLLEDFEGKVDLTLTGELNEGTVFTGTDTVKVVQLDWKHWWKKMCMKVCKK